MREGKNSVLRFGLTIVLTLTSEPPLSRNKHRSFNELSMRHCNEQENAVNSQDSGQR